jgi:hypothetical protein
MCAEPRSAVADGGVVPRERTLEVATPANHEGRGVVPP